MLNRISAYLDANKTAKDELHALKQPSNFRCDTATEEELTMRCRKLGKDEAYIKFCKLAWIDRKRNQDIADIMFWTLGTVKEYKRIRRSELESR